jgi:hypothetical protein
LHETSEAVYYWEMAEHRNRSGEKYNPPIASKANRLCFTCHYFDYGTCHKEIHHVAPESTCASWETRREIDGLTIWELLAREG